MATLKAIGTKIKTTKNIAKITNALEIVATIKLQKVKKETDAFKQYILHILQVASNVFGNDIPDHASTDALNMLHIVIGSDKGLCGPINTKLYKDTMAYFENHDTDMFDSKSYREVITIGKKMKTLFAKAPYKKTSLIISDDMTQEEIEKIHELVEQAIESGNYHQIVLHFTYFKNILKQLPTALCIYPFTKSAFHEFMNSIDLSDKIPEQEKKEYSFEPSRNRVKEGMFSLFSVIMVHGAILHHKTSEFAARMLAMKSSKDNANQIIDDLTIEYNKIRQDSITKEIVEIVGAKAVVDA